MARFFVTNAGGGNFSYSASADAPSTSFATLSGTPGLANQYLQVALPENKDADGVELMADRTVKVMVADNATGTTTLRVLQRGYGATASELFVTPSSASLSFSATAPPTSIEVRNVGAPSGAWAFTASPLSGTAFTVSTPVIDPATGQGAFTVSAPGDNTTGSARTGVVRVSSGGQNVDLTITQDAKPANGNSSAIYALRSDLTTDSPPWALMRYDDPGTAGNQWLYRLYSVVAETPTQKLESTLLAGQRVIAPYPLAQPPFSWRSPTFPERETGDGYDRFFKDRTNLIWAIAAGATKGSDASYFVRYFYNTPQAEYGFYDPVARATYAPGTELPWLTGYTSLVNGANGVNGTDEPTRFKYTVSWPTNLPEIDLNEDLVRAKNGLPEIERQNSIRIAYQSSEDRGFGTSARLIDYTKVQSATLNAIPFDVVREDVGGKVVFSNLPPSLKSRVSYDTASKQLRLVGTFEQPTKGDYYLLPNLLTNLDVRALRNLSPSNAALETSAWVKAINDLRKKVPYDVLNDQTTGRQSMALVTGGPSLSIDPNYNVPASEDPLYITIMVDNASSLTTPVDAKILKLRRHLDPGELAVKYPNCPFDERLSVMQKLEFSANQSALAPFTTNSDGFEFEWKFSPDIYGGDVPNRPGDPGGAQWADWTPDSPPSYETTAGYTTAIHAVQISEANPQLVFDDTWFSCRYRSGSEWSDWTDPQLAPSWIKRVIGSINYYDTRVPLDSPLSEVDSRFSAFADLNEVDTIVDMIQRAGPRWDGDIALNCNNLTDFGLIEVYTTVFNRAVKLALDPEGAQPNESTQTGMLLVASRIADLYALLANDAYADAADPTIGLLEPEYEDIQYTLHPFKGQTALGNNNTDLEEELALLRGLSLETIPSPLLKQAPGNKLTWNVGASPPTDGEPAYVNAYAITDKDVSGQIDEVDAQTMYPQGHGDAWGHYLSSLKAYYGLLRNPNFEWFVRTESATQGGSFLGVDFSDERKFALIAANKARTGTEIMNLTYRKNFVEDPNGQWQGYKDTYSDTITNHGPVAWRDKRAWGVSDWASRAGMGSYFDWVTANAILPSDTSGLRADNQRIDRGTVADLAQIPAMYRVLEGQMLTADFGLNPLGLASNAIPFSINSGLIGTKNHFEQTYDKATPALDNAKLVFDYARSLTGELRKQMDEEGQFDRVRGERERDLTGRLIEVFGYPYADDIGPGKLYNFSGDPAEYDGPDIFKYDVVDLEDIIGEPDGGVQTYSVKVRSADADYGNPCTPGEPDVHCVEFSLSTSGYGNIRDPQGPKSTRKAPGEIQLARGDLLQTRRRLEQGLANYDNLLDKIEDQRDLLEAQYNVGNLEIEILRDEATQLRSLNSELKSLRIKQLTFRGIAEQSQRLANASAEGTPGVFGVIAGVAAGTISDIGGAIAKGMLKTAAAVATKAASTAADAAQFEEMDVQKAKEDTQAAATISITSARNDFAVLQQQKILEELVRLEPVQRLELYALTTATNQAQGRYLATVQRGIRLLEERDIFRREESGDAVLRRYKNMAYRIYRDDAIQRYRAMFDHAARMVYLTAKAFDYETNALADASDATAGSRFLTNIVRSRSLGLQDGVAGGESSLADIMDSMKGAYDGTYKKQLEEELVSTKFSLRVENFGILPDESGIAATARADANRRWREKLASYVVPKLSDHPDYKEFCFPLTTPAAADGPAIVIDDISTSIADGVNFFGNQFNAYGSSQYNPQRASHKIKKMGVWYSNYNTAFQGLTGTPYMYFFPAGADLMRSPFDLQDLRSYTVYNQIIPTAQSFSVSGTNFQKPYWLPEVSAFGAVDNNLGTRVRYLTFRAFNSSATSLATDTIAPGSTELSVSANVGRSVWNDRWVLIIPGSGLGTSSDYNENIQRFIYGPLIAGGNGARDNAKAVTDIKLSFLTYSMNPIGGGTK